MAWRINIAFMGRKFPQFECIEVANTKGQAIEQAKRYAASCGFTASVKRVTAQQVQP